MKLLIMGAGYVGKALLSTIQNHEIYVTTTHEEKVSSLQSYAQHVLLLSSSQDSLLQETIDLCEGIVILIAPKNSKSYEETYLATAKTLHAILQDRKKPFYLLYTSSTSVYEGVTEEWASEETTLLAQSENAKILIETEKLFLNLPTSCILRLGGIYGPNRELRERAKKLSGQEMSGTGDEPTNHIHLEDIISALIFCLNHRLSGIYNLVNNDHTSRKNLYSGLCQSIGIPPPLWPSNPSIPKKKGYKATNQKILGYGFKLQHPQLVF